MTDEEKAKEISEGIASETDYISTASFNGALEMAKWKNKQFKDAIQKVRSDYMCLDNRSDSAICALNSVLNILKKDQ